MRELRESFKRFRLTLFFASVVFMIILTTMVLVFLGTNLLAHVGTIEGGDVKRFPLFMFCLVSILVGTIMSFIFSKAPLRPIREIMDATDKIADGDYSVRLDLKGPEEFRTLSSKFNNMAEEIGSVEMLRKDFVGNFSHEFKTPIVSIRGFARALKWDDLMPEEREEYLDIIINESERLAELSNNVLYLSKIEKQAILTNKRLFNLSEQIRIVIVLLDEKLTQKNLEIVFECDEHFVEGNEEMMKQVWINLLDNAIKFSDSGGKIVIDMKQSEKRLSVKISNQGKRITPEMKKRIFDKFYQGDLSHATAGNGLGLTIVKKIIDLHGGKIEVLSFDKYTSFEVILNNR